MEIFVYTKILEYQQAGRCHIGSISPAVLNIAIFSSTKSRFIVTMNLVLFSSHINCHDDIMTSLPKTSFWKHEWHQRCHHIFYHKKTYTKVIKPHTHHAIQCTHARVCTLTNASAHTPVQLLCSPATLSYLYVNWTPLSGAINLGQSDDWDVINTCEPIQAWLT